MAQREPMAVYSPLGYWTVPKSPDMEYPPFVPGMGRPPWLGANGQPSPGQPMPPQSMDPRAAEAIARMQAQAIQQPMPGDMPVGAPMPQGNPSYGPAFGAASPVGADPNSPTGGQAPRPAGAMRPGGQMPSTTPDAIQTAMAPIGGSAGPGTEIYGETYPPSQPAMGGPSQMPAQPPSAARGVIEEAMANRGSNAPWLALAAAGFGTAAGTSPHAMVNIGQGGLKGVEMYDRISDRAARDRLAAAQAMLGAEQQDRQAGFRQQELGQGEQRIGISRDELRSKDADRKQAREDAAAKLQFERDKERNASPERNARADYYSAQAEYTRDIKGRNPQAMQRDADIAADREAKAASRDAATGQQDGNKYQQILPMKKIESYVARGIPLTPDLKAYAMSQARAAIAKGADPAAVNQRLMQMGIAVEE